MIEIILTSSVLILLLVILRRALRGRISPCVQYALWLLVAARLLIPGTLFEAPVSMMGAVEELREPSQWSAAVVSAPSAAIQAPSTDGPTANFATLPQEPADVPAKTFTTPPSETRNAEDILRFIWRAGIAVTVGTLVLSNLIFYLRLRKNRKRLTLPDTPWSGELPVYEMEGLASPCLFGLFRPAIYLNETAMDAEHPEHILAHEYAHYRHGDHVWAILRSVCLAIHWYNPLVWWAAALSRRDCELACDASALRQLGEDARIDYGQTLLGMVSRSRNPAALLHTATTMTAGKKAMKERIALIIKQPRMRKITLAVVVLLACLLAACSFGRAAELPREPADVQDMPVAVAVGQSASSNLNDYSLITDPEEVKRLWELYQSFEYEGSYDPTGMGGWFVTVSFLFGDEPNDDTDVFFILSQHGIHTQDGEDLLLKNIDEIYAEFLRMSTANPITPIGTVPAEEAIAENARSIVEQVQQGVSVGEWLPLLNYMDWSVLAQAAVEAGMDEGDGSAAAVGIISAIDRYIDRQGGSMTMAEYLYILTATAGLDGAVTEGYAYVIHRIYIMNPSQFAYVVLEQLPEEQRDTVVDLFCSEWYYDWVSSSDLPTREEAIAQLEADLVAYIFASPDEMTLHSAGSTFQFQVFNVSGIYALSYESSDPSVASVDNTGVVTANAPGDAIITAHLEGDGGVRDFTSLVSCEWDAAEPVLPAPEEQEDLPADIAQYNEIIMGWQRAVGPTVGAAPAVPDQELIYDDLTEDGLRNAVVATLERYVTNNIFTHSLGDPADRLVLDHVELESEPRVATGQTDLTVNYHYVCKETLEFPNGQHYTATFAGSTLSTTFTAMSSSNVMGDMLANGAAGTLPWMTGNLTDLSAEIANPWQRGFAGFVFSLPAMPPQTLNDTNSASGDNLETALSMLSSYYQDYVAQNGASQYNDRFSRIIFVGTATESTADSVTLEVQYQVECLRDREYEGKTYTLAPQAGDDLKTTFTFMKTADSTARDDEAAAQFDQWVQHYIDILSPAPEGIVGYDSADERSVHHQLMAHLYPFVNAQFGDDFAANCYYGYNVDLAFSSVPSANEVPTSNFTLNYSVTVTASTRLPSGEQHSVKLTSRELTTTVTVANTAD